MAKEINENKLKEKIEPKIISKINTELINRELSWLRFNTRVLGESRNKKLPLLERLKFLSIYGTNLDEFYMVRVAGLKRLFVNGVVDGGSDKLTPLEQLIEIRRYLREEKSHLENLFFEIKEELIKEGLLIRNFTELSKDEKEKMKDYFLNYLYPIIVPIVVDSIHPFPHMNNLSFAIALKLKNTETCDVKYGIVRIPRVLKRFINIKCNSYVLIENIVGEFASSLFEGFETLAYMPFRVTRNADMEIEEDEADDFLELMSEGLRARKKGEIVRLEIGKSNIKEEHNGLLNFINNQIRVFEKDVYDYEIPIGISAFWELVGLKEFAHLLNAPYNPKILPPLGENVNIFECIEHEDVLLFHPYESFDSVINFISQAAKDSSVLSIRMTLYRVGKNSQIIKALTEAAENKQVTVLVELKARFDEENNLNWARALESAGAHVIYGVPGLKVHAKIALIVRKQGDSLKEYVHLSTGNYNAQTAKIYTDVSLLTSNKEFTKDAVKLFHSLSTGSSKKIKLNTLAMAPSQIKKKFIEMIENEIRFKNEGHIILKSNACVDEQVIRMLYKASNEGVKVDLIIRGICCLRPQVPKLSENIRVFSIIGKYLEHTRIYYFKHGKYKIYISSADMMSRNLERRVELLIPIMQNNIFDKLFEILSFQLNDNVQMHELKSDGEYFKISTNGAPFSSQLAYEEYITEIHNNNRNISKVQKLLNRMGE